MFARPFLRRPKRSSSLFRFFSGDRWNDLYAQDSEVVYHSPRIPNSGEKERTDRGLAMGAFQKRRRNLRAPSGCKPRRGYLGQWFQRWMDGVGKTAVERKKSRVNGMLNDRGKYDLRSVRETRTLRPSVVVRRYRKALKLWYSAVSRPLSTLSYISYATKRMSYRGVEPRWNVIFLLIRATTLCRYFLFLFFFFSIQFDIQDHVAR